MMFTITATITAQSGNENHRLYLGQIHRLGWAILLPNYIWVGFHNLVIVMVDYKALREIRW